MKQTIHVVGIGGVGMSALAQALLDQGHVVTGSDRLLDTGDRTPTLLCLERQGVKLFAQDGSGVTPQTSRIVVSTAIEADNPDMKRATELGVAIVHRAAALAEAVAGHKLCCVAGTCGKSSVTAILGHLLAETGRDPLVVNGAAVVGWEANGTRIGSVRAGKGEWAVIESDESDKSLMCFMPDATVVTNASADHFSLEEALQLFDAFCAKTRGPVVDGRILEGEAPDEVGGFDRDGIHFTVPLLGAHNVANARMAVEMAIRLGVPPAELVPALASFKGIERRLQPTGVCRGAAVYDDYAHNPEKLRAAWTTLQAASPKGVVGLWRPHGYGPLRKMKEALAQMFAEVLRPCDQLLLALVYDAGGTADRSVNSDALVEILKNAGVSAQLVPNLEAAEELMRAAAEPGRILAVFGARDPGLPRLAARLGKTE